MNNKNILPALTGLRFLAALNVVLYHFAPTLAATWPVFFQNLINRGNTSVTLFFILSGFILAYNYLDGRVLERKDFWVARFARIYPIFFVAFLLTGPFYLYSNLAQASTLNAITKTGVSALFAATLTQAWLPATALTWNGPAWSLSVEAFFYIIFPFVVPYFARLRFRQLISLIVIFWVLTWLGQFLYGLTNLPDWVTHLITFNPLFNLPYFLLGIALGKLYLVQKPIRTIKNSGLIATLAGIGVLLYLMFGQDSIAYAAILTAGYGLLVYFLAFSQGTLARVLSLPLLIVLGEASYGIYILQKPVAAIVRLLIDKRMDSLIISDSELFGSVLYLFFFIIVLIVLAVLGTYFIERPARNAIKRFFKQRAVPASLAEPKFG